MSLNPNNITSYKIKPIGVDPLLITILQVFVHTTLTNIFSKENQISCQGLLTIFKLQIYQATYKLLNKNNKGT